jgi:hypothetical protein
MEVSSQFHAPDALSVAKSPPYSLPRRLGGFQSPVDVTEMINISSSCRESNPDSSVVQLVA